VALSALLRLSSGIFCWPCGQRPLQATVESCGASVVPFRDSRRGCVLLPSCEKCQERGRWRILCRVVNAGISVSAGNGLVHTIRAKYAPAAAPAARSHGIMSCYAIGIGRIGSAVHLERLFISCASGLGPDELTLVFVDFPDRANGSLARTLAGGPHWIRHCSRFAAGDSPFLHTKNRASPSPKYGPPFADANNHPDACGLFRVQHAALARRAMPIRQFDEMLYHARPTQKRGSTSAFRGRSVHRRRGVRVQSRFNSRSHGALIAARYRDGKLQIPGPSKLSLSAPSVRRHRAAGCPPYPVWRFRRER